MDKPFKEESLEKRDIIKTLFGGTVRIEKFLAKGGQGSVYIVNYGGEKKALKWYTEKGLGGNPNAFYDNIKQNIMRGAPSKEFLWPLDITEWKEGTFGYIMDLRPDDYYELTQYMLSQVHFDSYRVVVDAALNIVSAFRQLHNAGYSYQDLNDGNFFINPRNGKVLICDNDNVAPDGVQTGVIGKPRYMAPEIVVRKKQPDSKTDRFSMSVILYILFCLNHPLEGKKYFVPALTADKQEKLYGSEPVFMMDPNNKSNEPDPKLNKNAIEIWKCLPKYMKEIFCKAFSQEALQNKKGARPVEIEWIKALTRFRSDIVPCSCGNEIFVCDGQPSICEECHQKVEIPFKLDLSDYSIAAIKGTRIYQCQIGVCDDKDALKPVAHVLKKKDSEILGIKNKSRKQWYATTTKGEKKKVAPDGVIPLKNGITFTINEKTIEIKENN